MFYFSCSAVSANIPLIYVVDRVCRHATQLPQQNVCNATCDRGILRNNAFPPSRTFVAARCTPSATRHCAYCVAVMFV
jgi:hypothetical protein